MCLHQNEIIDRCCNDCGMIVEQPDMVCAWTAHNFNNVSTCDQTIKELIGLGVSFDEVHTILDNITKVSTIKNCGLKGRRKRGLMFACIFAIRKNDPDVLRKKMMLNRQECVRGVQLYEECVSNVNWNWKMFLHSKLKHINLLHLENKVVEQLLLSKSKFRVSVQMVSCIATLMSETDNQEITLNNLKQVFGCEKIVKFKIKTIGKTRRPNNVGAAVQKANALLCF